MTTGELIKKIIEQKGNCDNINWSDCLKCPLCKIADVPCNNNNNNIVLKSTLNYSLKNKVKKCLGEQHG
jgi:hypothetical protein